MELDAVGMSEAIRSGKLDRVKLVKQSYQKIDKLNCKLNAVIYRRDKRALQEAAQFVDKGQPFAGIPLLLKGLGQSLAGERDTNGARLLQNNYAATTDNFVRRLEQAGFIIIGQTNIPEFGFKNITDPVLYGPARNPWNLQYSPGGSSGGSASAAAAGIVPLAAGNDGGGSIRIPASFAGLIGLKPTRGRVPVGPGSWRGWQGASINFGLTKSIRDTATLLDTLQVLQPAAPFQTPIIKPGFMARLEQPLKKNLKVAYSTESPVGSEVSEEAKLAVSEAVDFLNAQGIQTEKVTNPLNGPELMRSYYIVNSGETASMFEKIEKQLGRQVTVDDMELTTWVIYQAGLLLSAKDYSQTLSLWDEASAVMDQLYDSYDLYLTPTTAYTAPKIDAKLITDESIDKMRHVTELGKEERLDLIYEFFDASLKLTPFTQQANMTGQPAISLPTFISKKGLPLGIQFIGRKGDESTLLQVGQLFEQKHKFKMLRKTDILQ
ncbi:amidase [Liquorilactobacillus sucicola DSM 21376 = JCM 15457]|uniref:Amidase n=1 Tax=Liquorilactobacillus sucicola DSM 21376 = JCM 15457 TaxID=1423806 RepID=A0A0R2DT30_9LACO|nr:amidase [Liquorilactobacillus sucicola]KRN07120.1 amidase [Liquorilactobacillus sucicola DSM 21376 = JCM 15457]